jgi:hypothetical protein
VKGDFSGHRTVVKQFITYWKFCSSGKIMLINVMPFLNQTLVQRVEKRTINHFVGQRSSRSQNKGLTGYRIEASEPE